MTADDAIDFKYIRQIYDLDKEEIDRILRENILWSDTNSSSSHILARYAEDHFRDRVQKYLALAHPDYVEWHSYGWIGNAWTARSLFDRIFESIEDHYPLTEFNPDTWEHDDLTGRARAEIYLARLQAILVAYEVIGKAFSIFYSMNRNKTLYL